MQKMTGKLQFREVVTIVGIPLCIVFLHMLPNIRELNLSNVTVRSNVLNNFTNYYPLFQHCPLLEKITYNNIQGSSMVCVNGCDMRYAYNLKEIIMDDAIFHSSLRKWLSNLENTLVMFFTER